MKGNPEQQIRDAVRGFVKNMLSDNVLSGVVKSVSQEDKIATVTVDKDGLDVDCRLMALVADAAGKGITVFPTQGSTVLICQIEENDTDYYIGMFSQIDSFQIEIGDMKFFMDANGVAFNGGENGGLIIIQNLIDQLDKNNQILSAFLNALQTPINEPGNGSPSAFQAALKVAMTGLNVGDFSNIEDTKVKH